MGHDGLHACAARRRVGIRRPWRRHPGSTPFPQLQRPLPALRTVGRSAPDLGAALARPGRRGGAAGRSRPPSAPGPAPLVRPRRTRGPRDRLRSRYLHSGDGTGRTGSGRDRCRDLRAWAGTTVVRDRPRGAEQYPVAARRRPRRAGVPDRPVIADRGSCLLPRPVAQGPAPQAAPAATGHHGPDRRSVAAGRGAARGHRPCRLRGADCRVRRRRTGPAPGDRPVRGRRPTYLDCAPHHQPSSRHAGWPRNAAARTKRSPRTRGCCSAIRWERCSPTTQRPTSR